MQQLYVSLGDLCAIELCVRLEVDKKFCISTINLMRCCSEKMKWELQDLKIACSTVVLKLAGKGLQDVFEKWVVRFKKCIISQQRYFEKRPPQNSDSKQ